ncbi:MAG: UPF0149 family protein [Nevskiaceae bacterium]|nr:MAG: UPF0149 family protein [Nevskiaceae bacterium]
MQAPIHYDELHTLLASAGYDDDAAGYHGALCGALCVEKARDVDLIHLLDAGGDQPIQPDTQLRGELSRLREQTLLSLQDEQGGFAPLLPEDDAALTARVGALVAWCEGFLFGLSSRPQLDLKGCSEEAREIIEDFAQFTRASIGGDDDTELEENAYAELVEYIRVGAQLIYMELRPRPTPDPRPSKKVH